MLFTGKRLHSLHICSSIIDVVIIVAIVGNHDRVYTAGHGVITHLLRCVSCPIGTYITYAHTYRIWHGLCYLYHHLRKTLVLTNRNDSDGHASASLYKVRGGKGYRAGASFPRVRMRYLIGGRRKRWPFLPAHAQTDVTVYTSYSTVASSSGSPCRAHVITFAPAES